MIDHRLALNKRLLTPSAAGRVDAAWRRAVPILSPANQLLLIVDDDELMVRFAQINLAREGFRVLDASTGLEALKKVREELPDLVLLNTELPDMDGFEALGWLKEISSVPVILLSSIDDEDKRIRGLDLGAEDCLTTPYSPRELASRIRAVLRRLPNTASVAGTALQVDHALSVDLALREAIVDGQRVSLRPLEYRLLYHLVNNPGSIMPHETLLSKVWGSEYRDDKQLLRVYITYLRQKIEPDPSQPRYVLTERGTGYRFMDFRNT